MALTVRQVVGLGELGLVVRTSTASLDRPVRWVAVSELSEPAPWLDGGELLLTTGMSLTGNARSLRAYVDSLVAADVAALGFGVAISHDEIPAALLAAADSAGLPVLEVPKPVPFVAVGKAVLRQLTAEEYAESAASFEVQRKLIRAALGGDPAQLRERVVSLVARHTAGFAMVLDPGGRPRAAYPPAARARAEEFAAEVHRLRPRGLLASASLVTSDEHIVLIPLGSQGEIEGFLALGTPVPLGPGGQAVVNLAVSLLSWHESAPAGLVGAPGAWRELALRSFREHGMERDQLARLGLPWLDPQHVRVAVVRGDGLDRAERELDAMDGAFCARLSPARLAVLCGADAVDTLRPVSELAGVAAVGVSGAHDARAPEGLQRALREAEQAATSGVGLRTHGQQGAQLLSLVDPTAASAWATGLLAPVSSSTEGTELGLTLRAWLRRNGQVDAAAVDLGVHRHTVRHRLRRAEALLGRSLDDPDTRADLWQALSILDIDA